MAQPGATLILDADWSKGVIRDAPRGAIPDGGIFDAADYLFHKPGIAEKRGGTSYFGAALTGATKVQVVGWHQSSATVVAIDDRGHLFTVTSGTATDLSTLGSAYLSLDTPKYRVGASKNLLVITANDGTSLPKSYNGSAVSTLAATAPAGKYAAVYKTRLALAGTSANPDRLFFGPVPDITDAWDTTEAWIDTDFAITGLAALQNALIIFSDGKTQRITGTTPPPQTDMDRAPIGDVGCTDARSIVVYEGRVIFANPRGVYTTDGVTYQCLTRLAGVESLWRSYFEESTANRIACGILGSFLVACIRDESDANVATLMCNLARNAWWPVTNINAYMFATSVGGGADECWYADQTIGRVTALAGILSPTGDNKSDANGTAVEPMIEPRLLGAGPTLKHFGFGHLSMDMRDTDRDDPSMAISFSPGLEASSFAAVPESPFAETTDNTRIRFTMNKVTQGGTVRITQTNASSKTELYALELETTPLAFQAGGQ